MKDFIKRSSRKRSDYVKGHNVQYGAPVETMIYLGGGKLVEVGYANEGKAEHIEDAIGENTAAILYVKSHHAVQKYDFC